jgi:hypothetical protein
MTAPRSFTDGATLIPGISFPGGLGFLRGVWQYLAARSQARADVEKARITLERDRERDQAVAGYIAALPDNVELMDLEDRTGRSIWIRKRSCSPACPTSMLHPMVVFPEQAPIAGPAGEEQLGTGEITS